MATSNKDQLDRWAKQTLNALERSLENLEKMASKYEGKADRQYTDVVLMMTAIAALRDAMEEFYSERM